jgi:1,2-diacylglycerol 3-beta-galactosyltransferase
MSKRRILILTADAGFGHRSAANAVAAALQELYGDQVEATIYNPLDDKRTPFFLRDSQSDYDKILRSVPELYRLGYEASDGAVPGAIMQSAVELLLLEVMAETLRTYQPDAIVTTYPLYQAALKSSFIADRYTVPLLTVVTDLVTVHTIWFHRKVDLCLVPTEEVRELALKAGIPAERVRLTGIPVHPNVVGETRSRAEVRASLGWQRDLPAILAVGSSRVKHLVDALEVLNHSGFKLQLAVVAGKDQALFHQMEQIDWHLPVHLYEYVTNMPTLMHAADGLICKAGGLIVTEALACGLPLMLVDVLPGQEAGNASYVVENKAGDLPETPLDILKTMYHWLAEGGALLNQRAAAALKIGLPRAAFEVAELAWQAADAGPTSEIPAESRPIHLTELVSMLEKQLKDLREQMERMARDSET